MKTERKNPFKKTMRSALADAALLFLILYFLGCVAAVPVRERETTSAPGRPSATALNGVIDTFTGSSGAGVGVGGGSGAISEALIGDQVKARERKEQDIQLQIQQQELKIRRQQLEIRLQQLEIERLRKSTQGFY